MQSTPPTRTIKIIDGTKTYVVVMVVVNGKAVTIDCEFEAVYGRNKARVLRSRVVKRGLTFSRIEALARKAMEKNDA